MPVPGADPQTLCFTRFYSLERTWSRNAGTVVHPPPTVIHGSVTCAGRPLRRSRLQPQGLPVCPSCGAVVSDIKAQFCDACGAPLAKPVCPACGNTAPSAHSKFCTRCGTTFTQGGAATKSRVQAPPACCTNVTGAGGGCSKTQKRAPCRYLMSQWRNGIPWTDGDPSYDISTPLPRQSQPQKQYTDLQRVADEMARSQVQRTPLPQPEMVQFSEPKRKYSHLPLIADELKADLDQRNSGLEQIDAGKKSSPAGKEGQEEGAFRLMGKTRKLKIFFFDHSFSPEVIHNIVKIRMLSDSGSTRSPLRRICSFTSGQS